MNEISTLALNIPSPTELQKGEIAITYAKTNEGLWVKNTANEIIKIGHELLETSGYSITNGITQSGITELLSGITIEINEINDEIDVINEEINNIEGKLVGLLPYTGHSTVSGMTQDAITNALDSLESSFQEKLDNAKTELQNQINVIKNDISALQGTVGSLTVTQNHNYDVSISCNCGDDGGGGGDPTPHTTVNVTNSNATIGTSSTNLATVTVNGSPTNITAQLPSTIPPSWDTITGSTSAITLSTTAQTIVEIDGHEATVRLPDEPPEDWTCGILTQGQTVIYYIGTTTNVNLNEQTEIQTPTKGVEYYYAIENINSSGTVTITYPTYNGNCQFNLEAKKFWECSLLRMPTPGRAEGNETWLARTALTDSVA